MNVNRFFAVFLLSASLCIPALHATTWLDIIAAKTALMNDRVYALLVAQHKSYSTNDAPKIIDPRVMCIPIVENNEPVVDINQSNSARICMLPTPAFPFASPDNNSGFASASRIRNTVFQKLLIMLQELDALAPEFGYEVGQIDIKVFEGLRSLATQTMLFANKQQEIMKANQTMTEQEVYSETCKWVSPVLNNVPVHSTGGAIDIRLWDNKNNCFIDLGPFGAIWGKNTIAPLLCEDASDEQKNNRLLLIVAAARAELINYLYEYWHFSSGDRYAALWSDAAHKVAVYGPVAE